VTPLEIAINYIGRGWSPVPVPYRQKGPILADWQRLRITAKTAPSYFNGALQNIGVILGEASGGLADVDLDCAEARDVAPWLLPSTGAIFGRPAAREAHWLYVLAEDGPRETFEDPDLPKGKNMIVELRRGGGLQTVFPGSTHKETGEPIVWEADGAPTVAEAVDLLRRVRRLAAAALIARCWPGEGKRHDAAITLGGFLARAGFAQADAKLFCEAVARAAGDSEWRDRVKAMETDKMARLRGFPELAKLLGERRARAVAEWLEYNGQDDRGDSAAAAEEIEPVDLWGRLDPPDLPAGLLPPAIEAFAHTMAVMIGADPGGLAAAAMAVAAGAIPDTVRLQPKQHDRGWTEAARLWVALVGDPSTKKSPTIAAAVRPLAAIDKRLLRRYLAQLRAWEDTPKAERVGPPPVHHRVMLGDTTVEAAQQVIAGSPDGVLLTADELSGWLGSMERYNSGRGAASDRAFWLQAWNGGSYAVDRVGRGSSLLDNLSVSLLGGVQPEVIRKVVAGAADDGLLQRMFPIVLRPATLGKDEPLPDVTQAWTSTIEMLHAMRPPRLGGPGNLADAPRVLRFNPEAQALWREFSQRHHELLSLVAVNRKLGTFAGKLDGQLARLVVTWHCVEAKCTNPDPVVTVDTLRRAGAFLHKFLVPHAVAFYGGLLGLPDDHDRLANVADYILAHKLETVGYRVIQRGDGSMRDLDRMSTTRILEQLEALGWVWPAPPKRTDAPRWTVNPVVHSRFGNRADAERSRRAEARARFAEMAGGGDA
jgi:hypothetical protein